MSVDHCWMQAARPAGSSRANTLPKVSSDGMPFARYRNDRNQASRSLPKRSISVQLDAPAIVA